MNALLTTQETTIYSTNLLNPFWNFNYLDSSKMTNVTGNLNVVDGYFDTKYKGRASMVFGIAQSVETTFEPLTPVYTTLLKGGLYIISYRLKKDLDASNFNFKLLIFKNNLLFETLECDVEDNTNWNTYFNSFLIDDDDVLTFQIKVTGDVGQQYYFDGFKLELDDRNLSFPSIYTEAQEIYTEYTYIHDVLGTQNIIANTNTNIFLSTPAIYNGFQSNIDSNGYFKVNKTGVIDASFDFDFTVPSGTNNHIDVWFEINNNIIKSLSIPILKNTGDLQKNSIQFNIPITTDLRVYGGRFFIKSTVGLTITNRKLTITEYKDV